MALSGSFNGSTSNQYVRPTITWSASQSIADNYSDVTATLTYSRTNSGYTTSGKWSGSITINGTTTAGNSGNNQIYITQNSNTFAMSATTRVYHNGDGTKSITISATGTIPAASLTSTSISGTITLDTIPRAGTMDSLTCNTNYLDGTFTYRYTPKSSSFYNRLRVSIPNVVALEHINLGAKSASQQTGTYTLSKALLESIYNRYPSASTCTIGFVIETYSDSGYYTKVGESAELMVYSLNFPESVRPSIEGISWTKTSGEPDSWGLTQNVSSGKLDMYGVSTSYGSPIASYSLTFAGYSSTSSSLTIPNIASPGTPKAIARVTDTRGRFAEKSVDFYVHEYKSPQLKTEVFRCDSSGDEDVAGEYLSVRVTVEIMSIWDNALQSLTFKYKRQTGGGDFEQSISAGVGYIFEASSDYTWDWVISASDKVRGTISNGSIATGEVVLDISADGKSISFGKVSEHYSAFEVGNELTVGPIHGLKKLLWIPNGSNLDDFKNPGCYGIIDNASAESMTNIPTTNAGVLRVYSSSGAGQVSGPWTYITQEYYPISPYLFYRRLLYTLDDGTWQYGKWYVFHGSEV